MKTLSSAAAGVGVIASIGSVRESAAHGDSTQIAIDVCGGVSNAAVAIGQAMMGPLQSTRWATWMLRAGALANGAGVALAIGVFLAQIAHDVYTSKGLMAVFADTLERVRRLERAAGLVAEFSLLESAIGAASASMTLLRPNAGRSSDNPWSTRDERDRPQPPSYWLAAKLGLSERAIKNAFGVEIEVATCLAPFFDKPSPEGGR